MYYLPKILRRLKLSSKKNCKIEKSSKVLGGCSLLNVTMGRYSYIGMRTDVVNTDIGSFCSIAGNCMIGGGEHPIYFVSTSPVFHQGRNCLKTNFAVHEFEPFRRTKIGNDVWIGARCLIKGGVKIGTGAVVGMGSVVTHDIPPYEIWAGNPAHFIKKRFDDNSIKTILESKWWDLDDAQLNVIGSSFNDPTAFISNQNQK